MARYMRGSMSYNDVLNMSAKERASINEVFEEIVELHKKGIDIL